MYKSIVIHSRSTYWTNHEFSEEMEVDSDDLAKELDEKCNELEKQGFQIISILPVSSGNVVNGNGYYHTASIIITAHK
ncbi:MAG TPA: hypothetical protein PK252_05190 [Bacteroidales bacterium]|nr:hypothetical protein [Bacteroidales bacterium]